MVILESTDIQMGTEPPRRITEGSLSIDGERIFWLAPLEMRQGAMMLSAAAKAAQLYLVKVDFTLHPLTEGKVFKEVKMRVDLAGDAHDVELVDLFPKRLESGAERPRTLMVTAAPALVGVTDLSGILPIDELLPSVTGFRETPAKGQGCSWTFKGVDGGAVAPGSRSVYLLLKGARCLASVTGSISYEATVGIEMRKTWWSRHSESHAVSFQVGLI
jgi:hypothetical protein